MDDTPTFAPGRHRAARPAGPAGLVEPPRRPVGLASLRGIIATWGERIRFRREIERKLKRNPHLIDDIGLTRRQAEAEIAKPFWRA